ncbi:MAG: FAD:protein FMN transferase [Terriglobia bacterium]
MRIIFPYPARQHPIALWFIALLLLLPPLAHAAKPARVFKQQYAMGTVYQIVAYSESSVRASQAIDAAFREIVYLDHVMSNFDPASDLSQLDRSAHFHAARVPPDLFRVIGDSLEYSRMSQGKFDITLAPVIDLWKAAQRSGVPPSPGQIRTAQGCVGYRKIQLIPPDRIEFHSPCMRLDLGAIGKGYAVDRAVDVLRSYGIRSALVNAGGSTFFGLGAPPDQPGWLIHLRDPSGRLGPEIVLKGNSVSTSEQWRASLIDAGSFGHIVDPATDRPEASRFAVSVAAPTGTQTDGLSLTLFMLGPEAGSRLIRNRLLDTAAIWVWPSGKSETVSTGPVITFDRRDAMKGDH